MQGVVLRIITPVRCVEDRSPERVPGWQRRSSLTLPHLENCQTFLSPHYQSSQVFRGGARVSSNPLNVLPRVSGSPSGLLVLVSLFPAASGVSGGPVGGMLCSALGPQHWRDAPRQRGSSPGWRAAAGGPGAAVEEAAEEDPEEAAEEEGVGGSEARAAGPVRGGRSAVLPRSAPLLIFGLGCPCPGISRHASRRPVRRPSREGGRRRLGQRRRRPRPSMRPRRTLPRPLSLRLGLALGLGLCLAAARGAAHSGSCRDQKSCKVVFSQQELRKRLTPLQYHVTQEKGTESAFEGEYIHHKDPGIYKCVVCGTPLFNDGPEFIYWTIMQVLHVICSEFLYLFFMLKSQPFKLSHISGLAPWPSG
ncbi:methionine-R-sulfoxide reductase B3 isoform X3 [Equus asinus]|uniref:methionine-R-sulfoxide reductase B3 isoform X3 n=1 Tax=Equus asinus TaxID=9793 RepID=UPI0038F641E5